MIRVLRYSKEGFKPQKQTHHYDERLNYLLNDFHIEYFPGHLQWIIEQNVKKQLAFYEKYGDDLKEGIWCFIFGYKNNQSLNHLKELVPAWTAELPEDTICYDVNWEEQIVLSDDVVKIFGCYIPKRELSKLQNIQRYKKKRD